MLAGLQSQVDSLFPHLKTLVPTDKEMQDGEDKLKAGRVVRISGYKTEIFDMHDEKQRTAYDKRMMDLSLRAQTGTVRLLVHDRQVLPRKDGSQGWFGYLEWMEYVRTEADGSVVPPKKVSRKGK